MSDPLRSRAAVEWQDDKPCRPRARVGMAALQNDVLIGLGLLTLLLILNIPLIATPHFWDSLTFVAGADAILHNNFNPILPSAWDTIGHPVLFHEVLAAALLVFGPHVWVPHVVTTVFALIALYFTYRIGAVLFGRSTGLIAAVLLLFYPLFRTQATVVTLDLAAAAFAAVAVYCVVRRHTLGYLVSTSAMLLTKETGAFLVPAACLYAVLQPGRLRSWRSTIRTLMIYGAPVLCLVAWFWYHRNATGWVVAPDKLTASDALATLAPGALLTRNGAVIAFVTHAGSYFGLTFFVGLLLLVILAYTFSFGSGQPSIGQFWKRWGSPANIALLGVPIVLQLAFMSITPALHRYLLPEYPLFFILAARALLGILPRILLAATATAFMLMLFSLSWTQAGIGTSLESPSTLRYLDFVQTHAAGAEFIETSYPGARVLAGWPQYLELAMPIQGYVRRPIAILTPSPGPRYDERIVLLGGRPIAEGTEPSLEDFDLVYFAAHTPDEAFTRRLIERFELPLLAEFRKNAEYVGIYGKPRLNRPAQAGSASAIAIR